MARVQQWLAAIGSGFVDTFLRNNRVLPPVLALLALFVFAWILAGTFIGATGQEPVAHRADLAQTTLNRGLGCDWGEWSVHPDYDKRAELVPKY